MYLLRSWNPPVTPRQTTFFQFGNEVDLVVVHVVFL